LSSQAAPSARAAIVPRIVEVVLAGRTDRALPRFAAAVVAATVVHLALFAWATASGSSLAAWSAQLAAQLHEEMGRERVVELSPPPPPPPPKPVQPPPAQREPLARSPRSAPRRADSRPPPPAQAGRIIAQEGPPAPLDLTGDTFVTGTAQAYPGGVTSPSGTNPNAVESREVDPKAPPGEPDRSRRVALADEGCARWPPEAEAEPIDQKEVVTRLVIRPDGTVSSVKVIGDPGQGFAAAAIECAQRARFTPALDAAGRPIQVQVQFRWHFTR
jgi:periplasmic protein TonB